MGANPGRREQLAHDYLLWLMTAADGRWMWRPIGRLAGSATGSGSRFLFFFRSQTLTAVNRSSTGIMSSGSGRCV
jgi:hypothetical protein